MEKARVVENSIKGISYGFYLCVRGRLGSQSSPIITFFAILDSFFLQNTPKNGYYELKSEDELVSSYLSV